MQPGPVVKDPNELFFLGQRLASPRSAVSPSRASFLQQTWAVGVADRGGAEVEGRGKSGVMGRDGSRVKLADRDGDSKGKLFEDGKAPKRKRRSGLGRAGLGRAGQG